VGTGDARRAAQAEGGGKPVTGLLVLALLGWQEAAKQETTLRPPMTKLEEKRKFHSDQWTATPGRERLRAFEQFKASRLDSPFQSVPWRNIGPEIQSGRVIDADSPLQRPRELLVAWATGGLWRTEDDGTSWTPIFDDQAAYGIGDFAVSADGQTIWVGTGENNSQRTSYAGLGVFKSSDAGKTWRHMGLEDSHHIGKVLIDPRREDTVWVGALGPLYTDAGQRGVFKTDDGGRTWQHVLKLPEDTGCIDLDFDPRNPDVVYAATWERERRAWNFREGGPGTGVYKTTDGGRNWIRLRGLPTQDGMGRIGLAVAPSRPETVYVITDDQNAETDIESIDERTPSGRLTLRRFLKATKEELLALPASEFEAFLGRYLPRGTTAKDTAAKFKDGSLDKAGVVDLFLRRNPRTLEGPEGGEKVWRSDDGGKTWSNVSGRLGGIGGYYWDKISVHPTDWKTVYVCALFLLKSEDGGVTWGQSNPTSHVDHHVLWIDPRNPDRILNGNDGGPYLSLDGGRSWRHLNNLPVGQPTTIAVDDKAPYNVYVGLQDNGTMKGPSTYRPGRSDLSDWTTIGGGDGSWISVDPRNGGDVVYIASQFGSHSGVDQATRQRWSARATGKEGQPELRYNWISPLVISPHHPDIVYLGSQKIHRSFNQGRVYEEISGDLTRNREQGDVPHSTMTALTESPLKFGLIYAGADDGSLHVSSDAGNTWKPIPTPQPTKWVSRLVASKWDVDTVYCTQTGYREDDWTPYVWKSTDRGATWTSLAATLPLAPVTVIREDPVKKEILYLGTESGVWITRDGGSTWTPYGGGLPHLPVHDLAIQPKADEIVIATHGRSAWAVSLKPVRDLTPETEAKPLALFPVDSVTATDRWGMDGRGEWDRRPPNEPQASLTVWTQRAGPARLALLDKDGKEVKAQDVELKRGLNWVQFGLMLKPGDPNAPLKTGALEDPFADRRPTYVKPGEYKFKLTLGDQSSEGEFRITGSLAPGRAGN
jgi:photosystem II stability/assembly factor-like uncharacterized protein